MPGKMPRHYAIDFLAAKGRDAEKQALAGCPVEWQELVKTHIKLIRGKSAVNNRKRSV